MKSATVKLTFEVLIDESFDKISIDKSLSPTSNKRVLSLINDFEDGAWRYQKFQEFVWNNIKETALSLRERENLIDNEYTSLIAAAKNLRLTDTIDDDTQGSELAEIVLYGIMKHHYQALSVVPKIFYKQNSQDFAKGSDSIHIVLEGKDKFSIWFGEAKFYNSIEDARLDKIVQSVENSLQTDKLKKENSIITNVKDLDYLGINTKLKKEITDLLAQSESIDKLKPKLNIPILLLYQCDITQKQTNLSDKYKEEIIAYHKGRAQAYFRKQIRKIASLNKYSEIKFHIILFPVPLKSQIVGDFVAHAKHFKKK